MAKKGQLYKSKQSGVIVKVISKATGNRHWTVTTNRGKSHHIHEGTLEKYYEPLEK